MNIVDFARELMAFFEGIPGVKKCALYGSLVGKYDEYSDVDIALDVSGQDNGCFVQNIPAWMGQKYSVIFADFAPSLAPEKYVVSVAVDAEHPFRIVDIACEANPHRSSVTREQLSQLNDPYDHILKLFIANLKHFRRGLACGSDICRMYGKVFGHADLPENEVKMLGQVFAWLCENGQERHMPVLDALKAYM